MAAGHRDRLLGMVERRCLAMRNGASWQVDTARQLGAGDTEHRDEAMRAMLREYLPRMHSNTPVHEW